MIFVKLVGAFTMLSRFRNFSEKNVQQVPQWKKVKQEVCVIILHHIIVLSQ